MAEVRIEFSNPKAAQHFAVWLCEQGEQDYWTWMQYREEEEPDAEITAQEFKYSGLNKKKPDEIIKIGTKMKPPQNKEDE